MKFLIIIAILVSCAVYGVFGLNDENKLAIDSSNAQSLVSDAKDLAIKGISLAKENIVVE